MTVKETTSTAAISTEHASNGTAQAAAPAMESQIAERVEALQKELDQLAREEKALTERLEMVQAGQERLTGAIFENQRMLQTLRGEG